ncbi:MAG: phosphatase, partial [Proteobacteria bacterium]|nr:phosphatase [Pseudomonadota bacterium]
GRPYWFPDYLADLDALLARYSSDEPARLVGASMGGNVACLYAGTRPQRVARVVTLEGLGLAPTDPAEAPQRLRSWLEQLAEGAGVRHYPDFDTLAARLRRDNPRLDAARADFLARHLGRHRDGGGVELCADPCHKLVNPILYRLEEVKACWRNVAAPVLWVTGRDSPLVRRFIAHDDDYRSRLDCFRDVREIVVEEAGHNLHYEQPERVARLLEDFIAATDHDDVSGLAEAQAAAQELGVRLVRGVEISVTWQDSTVHVVGLDIDPDEPVLQAGLASIRAGRAGRAQRMAQALAGAGIRGALEGAQRFAANPDLLSRTHFARFLVEQGIARDVRSVFDHYLKRGKPGYVAHRWATLEQALDWIHGAGGIAVVAHPGRYRLGSAALDELFSRFCDLRGEAVEVMSGSHTVQQSRAFARVARRFGLLASRASDFHAPQESPVDLGRTLPLPDDLPPVWQRLM